MGKLLEMIARGEISAEELANASELINRAAFVKEGIEACQKTILFPLGTKEIKCYEYTDSAGEYQAWGTCRNDGLFSCYCNWGGNHLIGECNLSNFEEVFKSLDNKEFKHDLQRFLNLQISKL